MDMQEMANRMTRANLRADETIGLIRRHVIEGPEANRTLIAAYLKDYIAAKLLLSGDEISDNIVQMVRINVAKASHLSVEALKEMDRPGRCGSAPAVLSKRVLLLLSLQKALDITLPPREAPEVHTVDELADMIIPLMQKGPLLL